MSQPRTELGRYLALDGWRGVCAALVALYHFRLDSHLHRLGVVENAYLFVDFFFVLSGFVITHAYFDRLNSLRAAAGMLWRRLGRLWPLHAAMLTAFIMLELSIPLLSALLGIGRGAAGAFDPASGSAWQAIPGNLLLVHALGIHDRLTWNQPSWSISAELWTYVVFALVAVLGRRWTSWTAAALAAGGLLIVATFSTRHIAVDHDLGLFRCIAGFFVGHLVFRLNRKHVLRMTAPTLVEAATVLLVIGFVAHAGRSPWDLAAPLVFGLAVWVFAHEKGTVSAVLKLAPLTALGVLSYSIYMVHALLIAVVDRAVTVAERVLHMPFSRIAMVEGEATRIIAFGNAYVLDAVAVAYLLAVVATSTITWRYIEVPAQQAWNGMSVERLRRRMRPAAALRPGREPG